MDATSLISIWDNLVLQLCYISTEPSARTWQQRVLKLEPVSKTKDRMRQIVWQENVQDVIRHSSHEKPVIRRLEKRLAA